jgi:peptidoglycan/xylan/chitin deacetylase (PgdA/CDA1 family)
LAKVKTAMMKAAMSGLYHTGAHRLLAPYTEGVGLIFTLHQIRPAQDPPKAFAPNRILEVTPDFLDAVLDQVQEAGLDVVSIDEAVRRLKEEDERRFVCFTFDDGYRDNLEYAYPLFKRRGIPLTLYVPTDFPDDDGELWWIALEEIVARADEIGQDHPREISRLRRHLSVASPDRRGDAAPGGPRARRPIRGRHGGGLPAADHGLGRDQDHGSRSARHGWRAYQGTLRGGQAVASAR